METKICSCGAEMVLREGVSKTNKPWKGWFCPVKCGADPVFIHEPKASNRYQKSSNIVLSDQQYQTILTALRETYMLIKVVAYKTGLTDRDIAEDLAKLKQ